LPLVPRNNSMDSLGVDVESTPIAQHLPSIIIPGLDGFTSQFIVDWFSVDHKALVKLAMVCSNWRNYVYQPKFWRDISFPVELCPSVAECERELLNAIQQQDKDEAMFSEDQIANHKRLAKSNLESFRRNVCGVLKYKLYSTLKPPENNADWLTTLLERMSFSSGSIRFQATTQVNFANFMLEHSHIELICRLFPQLQKLYLDGPFIETESIEFISKRLINLKMLAIDITTNISPYALSKLSRLSNSLEKIAIFPDETKDMTVSGFERCIQCHFLYNIKMNHPNACLYHPGTTGYVLSCCGSSVPKHIGTAGCTFGSHRSEGPPAGNYKRWLRELYDVPYFQLQSEGYDDFPNWGGYREY